MKQNHVGCGDNEQTEGVLEETVHKGMQVLTREKHYFPPKFWLKFQSHLR